MKNQKNNLKKLAGEWLFKAQEKSI